MMGKEKKSGRRTYSSFPSSCTKCNCTHEITRSTLSQHTINRRRRRIFRSVPGTTTKHRKDRQKSPQRSVKSQNLSRKRARIKRQRRSVRLLHIQPPTGVCSRHSTFRIRSGYSVTTCSSPAIKPSKSGRMHVGKTLTYPSAKVSKRIIKKKT